MKILIIKSQKFIKLITFNLNLNKDQKRAMKMFNKLLFKKIKKFYRI